MARGSAMIGMVLALGLGSVACTAAPTADSGPPSTVPSSTMPSSTVPSSTVPPSIVPPTTSTPEIGPDDVPVADRWITSLATSPDGRFVYSAASLGTSARGHITWNGRILVDAGAGPVPAIADDRDEFDTITDFVFGPDGLVAFVSADENYGAQLFLGRLADNGAIIDLHRIPEQRGQMIGAPAFDDDGVLRIATRGGQMVHDTAADPFFVMSASPVPSVEIDVPLAPVAETDGPWARDVPGSWYRGETLATDPACGSSTLYKDDADGFARVLAADIELDRVVAVDVSPTTTGAGADTAAASRSVVISTECPDDYEGRRVYFGLELINYGDGGPRWEWPFVVTPIGSGSVAEVVGVRETRDTQNNPFGSVTAVEIDVVGLDGAATTITVDLAHG